MRNIFVILGSKSDLPQCRAGLKRLAELERQSQVKVKVYVRSAHRHVLLLHQLLRKISHEKQTDVIIAGAGKAAALPGCVDAFLRNELEDTKISVIGVAFVGRYKEDNDAATLGITKVPGTQVVYAGAGPYGFSEACDMALEGSFPAITLPEIPPSLDLTLDQAIQIAEQAEVRQQLAGAT